MITEIRVPKLGDVQESIAVIKWLKGNHDAVEKDQPVVIIETAKVTFEVLAPASGLLLILKRVNEKVNVGDILGVVTDTIEELDSYQPAVSVTKEATRGTLLFDEEIATILRAIP